MPRDFSEPWEPEDIFDQQEAAERRRRMKDLAEHNAALAAQEEAADAARRAETAARAKAANDRTLIAQYRAAGVEPPQVNDAGVPLVSLSMLLSLGWTIFQSEDGNQLLKPCHTKPARKRREDYDHNS